MPGEPLDISEGKWLLNPGAVGAPHGALPHTTACWLAARPRGADRHVDGDALRPRAAAERARRLGFEL